MPSYVTHIMFGELVKRKLELRGLGEEDLGALEAHPTAYHWGTQGPDILFFRNGFKKAPNPLGDSGAKMHKIENERLFQNLLRYLREVVTPEDRGAATAYAWGFVCHYGLDRTVHPYVYFMQEKRRSTYTSSVPYGIHMKLETDMDTALYTLMTGKEIRRFRQNPRWVEDGDDIAAICRLQSWLIRETYGDDYTPEFIRPCIYQAYRKEQMMFDPTYIKSYLYCRWFELLYGEKNTHCANCRPKRVAYDVLNQERRSWMNFREPERERKESVPQLIQEAEEQTADLIVEFSKGVRTGVFPQFDFSVTFDDGNPAVFGVHTKYLEE